MDSVEFSGGNVPAAQDLLKLFDSVFEVLEPRVAAGISDAEVELKVAERTSAKKAKDFVRADRIREELLEKGIVLEDTKSGVRWKRKSP